MRPVFCFVITCLLLVYSTAYATDYHVATSGNNSNTGLSLGAAWLTIQKAADTMGPGDRAIIHAGTYSERVVLGTSGSSGALITFEAAAGETPIIDGTGITVPNFDGLFSINTRSYIRIAGLTIQDSNYYAIAAFAGTNRTIEGNSIFNSTQSAIFIENGTTPNNSIIRNNIITNVGQGGIVIWNNSGGYFLIEGNIVSEIDGASNFDGIEIVDTHHVIAQGNTIHSVTPIGSGGGDHLDAGGNIGAGTTHHIILDNNVLYVGSRSPTFMKMNNKPTLSSLRRNRLQGMGIEFYDQPHTTVSVSHNTVESSDGHCVQFWNNDVPGVPFGGIKFKNNACTYSGNKIVQHQPLQLDGGISQILMDGNLYAGGTGINWALSGSNPSYGTGATEWNNWKSGTGQEPSGGVFSTQALTSLYVNHTARNYTPQSGSDLIDAAIPLTTTVGSGSGTNVTVAEWWHFHDGYGMTSGDTIRVGTNPPTQIVSINEGSGILTLGTSISWGSGDPVNFDWQGAGPDIGAVEFPVAPDMGGALPTIESAYQPFSAQPTYSSLTITSVNASVGTDRALAVCVTENGATNTFISSVVFNGSEAFTDSVFAVQGASTTVLYYLANPTATTANIVITLNQAETNGAILAAAVALSGAQQTIPTLTNVNQCASCTGVSAGLTTTVDNTLLLACSRSSSGGSSWTHGSGQTEIADFVTGGIGESLGFSSEGKATAGLETLTATASASGNTDYVVMGVAPGMAAMGGGGRRRVPVMGFK